MYSIHKRAGHERQERPAHTERTLPRAERADLGQVQRWRAVPGHTPRPRCPFSDECRLGNQECPRCRRALLVMLEGKITWDVVLSVSEASHRVHDDTMFELDGSNLEGLE